LQLAQPPHKKTSPQLHQQANLECTQGGQLQKSWVASNAGGHNMPVATGSRHTHKNRLPATSAGKTWVCPVGCLIHASWLLADTGQTVRLQLAQPPHQKQAYQQHQQVKPGVHSVLLTTSKLGCTQWLVAPGTANTQEEILNPTGH
jgi:hypothetical protein